MLQKSVLKSKKYIFIAMLAVLILLALASMFFAENVSATTAAEEEIQKELEDNVNKNLEDIDFSELVQFEKN